MAAVDFGRVLREWQELFGEGVVITAHAELTAVEQSTFRHSHRVLAILRPAGVPGVVALVRMAHDARVPLFPISRGKNWGYGSRVPAQDQCVLLDLSRLTQISDYDELLGLVTVEPGVTFRQLAHFLRERDSPFFIGAPATSPDASVLGNALERGVGVGRLADRVNSIGELEVVLANGTRFSTGVSRYGSVAAAGAYRGGPGPDLSGLFLQSNFGIVTRMRIQLDSKPKDHRSVEFDFASSALPTIIDRLRELYASGVLNANFVLSNRTRVAAGRGLVKPTEISALPDWLGTGAIYSPSASHGRLSARCFRIATSSAADRVSITSDALASGIMRLRAVLPSRLVRRANHHLESKYVGHLGGKSLQLMYWGAELPEEQLDPDRHRRGLRSYSFVIPLIGVLVDRILRELTNVVASHGMAANAGLNVISNRVAYGTLALLFDMSDEMEDARAARCFVDLTATGRRLGIVPARMPLGHLGKEMASVDDFDRVVGRIKACLDPRQVIAPGRYQTGIDGDS